MQLLRPGAEHRAIAAAGGARAQPEVVRGAARDGREVEGLARPRDRLERRGVDVVERLAPRLLQLPHVAVALLAQLALVRRPAQHEAGEPRLVARAARGDQVAHEGRVGDDLRARRHRSAANNSPRKKTL